MSAHTHICLQAHVHTPAHTPPAAANQTVVNAVVDALFQPQPTVLSTSPLTGSEWRVQLAVGVTGPTANVTTSMSVDFLQPNATVRGAFCHILNNPTHSGETFWGKCPSCLSRLNPGLSFLG